MHLLGIILSINIIALTAFLLLRKCSPALTLLTMGLLMFACAFLFNINGHRDAYDAGFLYSMFDTVYGTFRSRLAEAGLLIMLFGGYIEYMKQIHASDEMIYVFMRPLSICKKYPYLSGALVLPVGIVFYMAIPSATAMGLLLVATVYPVLLGLGLGRKTALSIISACTALDLGLASFNSNMAAEMLNMDIMDYFAQQLAIILPMIAVMILSICIFNKWMDRKESSQSSQLKPYSISLEKLEGNAPLVYALLPILPILVMFLLPNRQDVVRNVSIAILISFFISGIIDSIVKKSAILALKTMNSFWKGVGRICTTAVALMICADIFSQGLVHLGLPDSLVSFIGSMHAGKFVSTVVLSFSTFISTLIVGSGVSFYSVIMPMLPDIASTMDISLTGLTMLIQLIAGIARTASPIAVVIISVSEIAGVSPIELAKRNIVPMALVMLTLIVTTLIVY